MRGRYNRVGENEQCSHPSAAFFCLSGPVCRGIGSLVGLGLGERSLLFLLMRFDPSTTIHIAANYEF